MAPTAPVPGPSKLIPIAPEPAPTPPPKRRQVKRACTKCAKSSKVRLEWMRRFASMQTLRPLWVRLALSRRPSFIVCLLSGLASRNASIRRYVFHYIPPTFTPSNACRQRKERKKGTKRGPYKKRHSVIAQQPLPVVDQSAIPDAMGYAYSTFYAGPGPDVEPPQLASYYVPGMMLPPMLAPPFLPPPQPPQQQTHTQKQREAALLAGAPKPSAMPVMPFHAYAGFAPQQPGLDNYPYQRYPDYSNSRAD
ncbi:Zn(2)-C6 fungal-type domain-containing protein [Mycena chlorophos]|uniref:Zn(2)-C6 fungal-type domain-containing protein n=1 Tax=Mycena chlorophos TaxID=658473 RepID=A0A8H6TP88_MYCCL|nr:Zn(2)-C6 fungal-type domain-containing protein [Mycena chlorophos]